LVRLDNGINPGLSTLQADDLITPPSADLHYFDPSVLALIRLKRKPKMAVVSKMVQSLAIPFNILSDVL